MKVSKNEKFLILKNIKKFILGLETMLITFPKKDTYSKDRVYNDALELIEYVTIANYEKRVDMKTTYKIKALAKINKLDFYLERAYKLKYIIMIMTHQSIFKHFYYIFNILHFIYFKIIKLSFILNILTYFIFIYIK